jgi:hypothetical protein
MKPMLRQATKSIAMLLLSLSTSAALANVNARALMAPPSEMAFNQSSYHAAANTPNQRPSLLAVVLAQTGFVQRTSHGYTLALSGVDPRTYWFTDRPERQAGFILTQAFIENWAQAFHSNSPNVALVNAEIASERGGMQPIAVKLINPRVQNGQLVFTLMPLNNMPVPTGRIAYPALFIDNIFDKIKHGFEDIGHVAASGFEYAGGAFTWTLDRGAGNVLFHKAHQNIKDMHGGSPSSTITAPSVTMQQINYAQEGSYAVDPYKTAQAKVATSTKNSLAASQALDKNVETLFQNNTAAGVAQKSYIATTTKQQNVPHLQTPLLF